MLGPGAGDSNAPRREGLGRADAEDGDRAGRGEAARARCRAGQGREGSRQGGAPGSRAAPGGRARAPWKASRAAPRGRDGAEAGRVGHRAEGAGAGTSRRATGREGAGAGASATAAPSRTGPRAPEPPRRGGKEGRGEGKRREGGFIARGEAGVEGGGSGRRRGGEGELVSLSLPTSPLTGTAPLDAGLAPRGKPPLPPPLLPSPVRRLRRAWPRPARRGRPWRGRGARTRPGSLPPRGAACGRGPGPGALGAVARPPGLSPVSTSARPGSPAVALAPARLARPATPAPHLASTPSVPYPTRRRARAAPPRPARSPSSASARPNPSLRGALESPTPGPGNPPPRPNLARRCVQSDLGAACPHGLARGTTPRPVRPSLCSGRRGAVWRVRPCP
eukprot:XP_020397187.1 uncharacterized protein LOC109941104 [Zea mays]